MHRWISYNEEKDTAGEEPENKMSSTLEIFFARQSKLRASGGEILEQSIVFLVSKLCETGGLRFLEHGSSRVRGLPETLRWKTSGIHRRGPINPVDSSARCESWFTLLEEQATGYKILLEVVWRSAVQSAVKIIGFCPMPLKFRFTTIRIALQYNRRSQQSILARNVLICP